MALSDDACSLSSMVQAKRNFRFLTCCLIVFLTCLTIAASDASAQGAGPRLHIPDRSKVDTSKEIITYLTRRRNFLSRSALCRGYRRTYRYSNCDADGDYLTNYQETYVHTSRNRVDSDNDGLLDGLEVLVFMTNPRKADTDGDGIVDGNDDSNRNGVADEDEDDRLDRRATTEDDDDKKSTSSAKECQDLYDSGGNTKKFKIPSGLTGNLSAGEKVFAQRCRVCHMTQPNKGAGLDFMKLKTVLAGPPMFIRDLSPQALADLTAWVNRVSRNNLPPCEMPKPRTPAPAKEEPTPKPISTNTPRPTAAQCGTNPFDDAGNTRSFKIPSGTIGNVAAGDKVFAQRCFACHMNQPNKGAGLDFMRLKTVLAGAPMFITNLSEKELADLTARANKAANSGLKPCPDATATPTKIPTVATTPTRTPTPTSQPTVPTIPCGANPFDEAGNTRSFGIPSGTTGNIAAGDKVFEQRCLACHMTQPNKGAGLDFMRLKTVLAGAPMFITNLSEKELADLTARANKAADNGLKPCPNATATPTRIPTVASTPTRTPIPTIQPTALPGSCGTNPFDSAGNTSSFNIPSGFVGNIASGDKVFGTRCLSCHMTQPNKGAGLDFMRLKTVLAGAPMFITNVPTQELADLTARANKAADNGVPPCPGGTATPTRVPTVATTPTPMSAFAHGKFVYETRCQSCHPRVQSISPTSAGKIQSAIRDTRQMRNIVLSSTELTDLVLYINSPRAASENPAPNQTPTPTPIVPNNPPSDPQNPPGGVCGTNPFDANGNTNSFGIPSALVGNIIAGQVEYQRTCSGCHAIDRGTGWAFQRLKDALAGLTGTPMRITLPDQSVSNLVAYLNRASNNGAPPCNGGGGGTGGSGPVLETPPTPTPMSPLAHGQFIYETRCQSCHPSIRELESPSAQEIQAYIRKVKQMNNIVLTSAEMTNLVQYLAQPQAGARQPTPTPTLVTPNNPPNGPQNPPGGVCGTNPFDASGNTNSFGIPSALVGNITAGQVEYQRTCSGCHAIDRGTGWAFQRLKDALAGLTGTPMRITLPDQSVSNLVAYLNRASNNGAPSCNGGGGPVLETPPIPTPMSPSAHGQFIFETRCQSCHPSVRELESPTAQEIQAYIRKVKKMNNIVLTPTEMENLVQYLAQPQKAVPGGETAECDGEECEE